MGGLDCTGHIGGGGLWHLGPRLAGRRIKALKPGGAIFELAVDIVLKAVHWVLRQRRA